MDQNQCIKSGVIPSGFVLGDKTFIVYIVSVIFFSWDALIVVILDEKKSKE